MEKIKSTLRKIVAFSITIGLFACGSGSDSENTIKAEKAEKKPLPEKLFTKVNKEHSGLDFYPDIKTDEKANYYEYINVYNGGGVAVGDVNNDGLPDVYFTGQQVSNKLYINKGDMKFEDVTATAGVDGQGGWSTGVTMVDINADGWLDIYVCRAFHDDNKRLRENLLYVNNQDGTFSEKGGEYGVNDDRYSIHALFFDYDNDQDLDLYLGNFPRFFERRTDTRIGYFNNPPLKDSDKLYKNNGDGTFTDVTSEAGVRNYGWTLGIMTGDVNKDGYADIYVAVDHTEPDYLYLNNGDGTFTNAADDALKHIASFGMGTDMADFNNDGWLDVIEVDMMAEDNYRKKTQMSGMNPEKFWYINKRGYHFQYMRNALQLNNGQIPGRDGEVSFSEIGQMAGVSSTDWSWAPLFADFDNDGHKDLFVSNGYRWDVRDNDYLIKFKSIAGSKDIKKPESIADMMGLVSQTKLPNYFFMNKGDLTFEKALYESGVGEPSFSSGAAYADLDLDGDLDLVVSNLADPPFLYQNNINDSRNNLRVSLKGEGKNLNALGAKVTIKIGEEMQYQELTLTHGYQSSVEPVLHFGINDKETIDEVIIDWPDNRRSVVKNVKANQVLVVEQSKADKKTPPLPEPDPIFAEVTKEKGIDWKHEENEFDDFEKEILLPHRMSRFGPAIAVGDANGDGTEDFYVGGAAGQSSQLYLQNSNGSFKKSTGMPWEKDKNQEDIDALFFDADGDGDNDLYVVSGGGGEFEGKEQLLQDRLYENTGNGKFKKSNDKLPTITASGGSVSPSDYDNDGDIDLFVGGRVIPGKYPFAPRSYLLQNNGGKFKDITKEAAPDLVEPGLVTEAIWTDFDKDNQLDLLVVGEWMPISFFKNDKGKFSNVTATYNMQNATGWWNTIAEADIDNDGDMDFIAGNKGKNTKFKASEKAPFHVYCHDFDESGTLDIVLSYYNQGAYYPVRGRQCSSEQMPNIKEKFKSYDEFAKATIEDVLGENINEALHYQAETFETSWIENKGNGEYELHKLPVAAQITNIFGIIAQDFNGDNNPDLLLAGNFHSPEVETTRDDAGVGVLMLGDGKGNFSSQSVFESGFYAPHDVKGMKKIKGANGREMILIANNNNTLQLYRWNQKRSTALGVKTNKDKLVAANRK